MRPSPRSPQEKQEEDGRIAAGATVGAPQQPAACKSWWCEAPLVGHALIKGIEVSLGEAEDALRRLVTGGRGRP